MSGRIYKKVEVVGASKESLEDAIRNAVARTGETVRNMGWFEVVETRGRIEGDQVDEWQVTVRIGFSVE